jgi:hypothetical protein
VTGTHNRRYQSGGECGKLHPALPQGTGEQTPHRRGGARRRGLSGALHSGQAFRARWQRYPNVTGARKTTPCGFAAFFGPGEE